jgi:hypothetical protein
MIKVIQYIAVLTTIAAIVFANPAFAQDEFDCEDFSTQQQAQTKFDQDTSDPYGLDEDLGTDDGKACETLPSDPNRTQANSSSQYQYSSGDQYGQHGTVLPFTGGIDIVRTAIILAIAVALILFGVAIAMWVRR